MPGLLSQIFGSTPELPTPQSTQQTAITGNTGELGNLGALTTGTDTISAQGAALPYELNLPDYSGLLSSATGNVAQELSGQIPQDVQNLISTEGAERGVATGQGAGSPDTTASLLQALGLTSLGEESQGMQGFAQLMQQTPTGQPFNPASMFVSPESQQAYGVAQAQYNAAPNPVAAGIYGSLQDLQSEALGAAGMFV